MTFVAYRTVEVIGLPKPPSTPDTFVHVPGGKPLQGLHESPEPGAGVERDGSVYVVRHQAIRMHQMDFAVPLEQGLLDQNRRLGLG